VAFLSLTLYRENLISTLTKHYLWLIVLSVLTIWQALSISEWPQSWINLIEYAPYVLAIIGGFISIWLNRLQPLLLLLSVVLVNLMLAYFSPADQVSVAQSILFPIISFLLPLNIFIWILMPEKGVQNRVYNAGVASILAIQILVVFWFMSELPLHFIEWISLPILPGLVNYHLPFVSTLMLLLTGFLLSLRLHFGKDFKILNHSVIFILLLMAFGLNMHQQAGVLSWVSSMVGLVVILSLVFDAHHLAYTDELTGLKGRRALMESFMGLGKRYSIAMVDIDHFKNFNDTYGHDTGDDVLRTVASVLGSVQAGGKAYRYGGEEFTLLFPGKSTDMVLLELERLREEIQHTVMDVVDPKKKPDKKGKPVLKAINVTVSIGVAEPNAEHTAADEVMKFADEGLYKAKRTGRNKVVVSGVKVKATTNKTSKAKKTNKAKAGKAKN